VLEDAVRRNLVITSASNMTRMKSATAGGKKINGVKHMFRANHNIDINIWGDNKDMVSLIFDLIKHFVISSIDTLHELGIDVNGSLSGRRSGDVNVEFGKLLYGANVTIPTVIQTTSMVVDLPIEEIAATKINAVGDYQIL
jgi:hypothetical protein